MPQRYPITLVGYRLLTTATAPLAPVLISQRLKRGKEHPTRRTERFGRAKIARPSGPLIWIHCASVGELLTVIPLIERLQAKGFEVLCTSGTLTSASLAETRLPPAVIHQFITLDVPQFVDRFFQHWRPDMALFVESDLWPNLIVGAAKRNIPLILINGRLSERSFKRWRWAPGTAGALLRSFDLCLAQSATYAARFRDLGAPRIGTTGNLKLDVPDAPADEHALAVLRDAIAGRQVFAATSTHAGEETSLVEVHRRLRHSFPQLLTIIAPRHPERGQGIMEIVRAADLRARMRSRGELPAADTDIYIADTIGELGLIYRLSPIVFVGGSLASHGGQNPIEAAKLGAAIVHGPHVWNFAEIYAALDKARGAEIVTDVGKLAVRVGAWLKDAELRGSAAAAARETVISLGGALERTVSALDPYLMQIRLERNAHHA